LPADPRTHPGVCHRHRQLALAVQTVTFGLAAPRLAATVHHMAPGLLAPTVVFLPKRQQLAVAVPTVVFLLCQGICERNDTPLVVRSARRTRHRLCVSRRAAWACGRRLVTYARLLEHHGHPEHVDVRRLAAELLASNGGAYLAISA